MTFCSPRVDLTVKIIELTPTADDFSCIFSILTPNILKNVFKIKGTIHKSINKFHALKVDDCLELKNAVVFDQFDLILFVNTFNILKINEKPLQVPQKHFNYFEGILNNCKSNHGNSPLTLTHDETKEPDLDQDTLQIKTNETEIIIAEKNNNQQELSQSSDSDDYSNLNFLESAEFSF